MGLREYIAMIEDNAEGLLGKVKLRIYRTMLAGFKLTVDRFEIVERDVKQAMEDISRMNNEIHVLKQREMFLTRCLNKVQLDLGATARQTMLAKWRATDILLSTNEKPSDILTCKICGCSHQRAEYEEKISECIFYGGKLVRYICPDCGVIFGPTKFTAQGQSGIDEDYWVHYLGFSESDATYKEERAFFMLKPEKGKVYLNYGCGKWTKSLQNLRDMGYIVYGYEPYAAETENPYLITRCEELLLMRFDGIYSNDVLEHFVDPIEDMSFMAGLLKDAAGRMAHSTACYIYKYEYTRFHTHFFLGDSVKILAERSGLRIVDCCDDLEAQDFYCYVYALPEQAKENREVLLLAQMRPADGASLVKGQALIEKNGALYGPYMSLLEGKCRLYINIASNALDAVLQVMAEKGAKRLHEQKLCDGENMIALSISEYCREVEFIIKNFAEDHIIVDKIALVYE